METLDVFDLHDLMLNEDDDNQDAYCKPTPSHSKIQAFTSQKTY